MLGADYLIRKIAAPGRTISAGNRDDWRGAWRGRPGALSRYSVRQHWAIPAASLIQERVAANRSRDAGQPAFPSFNTVNAVEQDGVSHPS